MPSHEASTENRNAAPVRILYVAMPGSIHAARWINQVTNLGWDVHVFASVPTVVRPEFRNVTIHGVSTYRPSGLLADTHLRGFWPFRLGAWHVGMPLKPLFPARLAALVRRLEPDLVHALEIQHAGYLTLEAKRRLRGRFPPWIVSNWGSDIYFFGRRPEHEQRIKNVMAACDYLHAECERDVRLAREFGFRGDVFGVFPGGGGFDLEQMRGLRQAGPTSARRLVVIKGSEDRFGRALVGLRALELCADALRDYRVVVPLASPEVKAAALRLARESGLTIEAESEWMSRESMLGLHGRARISIRLGVSDAASHTLLEALAMGSFPIVSCTSCADEWVVDGESGLIVPPEDPAAVADAIRRALADDELVDRAAERNALVAAERLDEKVVRPQVIERYREVLAR